MTARTPTPLTIPAGVDEATIVEQCRLIVAGQAWRFANLPGVTEDEQLQAALLRAYKVLPDYDARKSQVGTFLRKPVTLAMVDLYRSASRRRANDDKIRAKLGSGGVQNLPKKENNLEDHLAAVFPVLVSACSKVAAVLMPPYAARGPRRYTRHQLLMLLLLRAWTKQGYNRTLTFVERSPELKRLLGLQQMPRRRTLGMFARREGVKTAIRSMAEAVRSEMRQQAEGN